MEKLFHLYEDYYCLASQFYFWKDYLEPGGLSCESKCVQVLWETGTTEYFLNLSVHLPIIIMKYVIFLEFNQEYIWITYYHGACAIHTVEENTDRFPGGFGRTVSKWFWLWFQIFYFRSDSLKNMLMSSVSFYAEVTEHSNICSMLSLAEGILLSIYCMGCCVILFPRVRMGVK